MTGLPLPIVCLLRPCLSKEWVCSGGLGKRWHRWQARQLLGLKQHGLSRGCQELGRYVISVDAMHPVGIDGDVDNRLLSLPERDIII